MIEIIDAQGAVVDAVDCPRQWPTKARSKARPPEPVDMQEFLREEHHRYYGRPWVLGRYYFEELVRRGLRRDEKVLDIGCGSGRIGALLAGHLDAGGYFGIDAHLRALLAFARYECVIHGVESKRPTLMFSETFDVSAFGVTFDAALDFYVTEHLEPPEASAAFRKVFEVTRPGARLFMPHPPQLGAQAMADLGFGLSEQFDVEYPLLVGSGKSAKDSWHVFARL